MTMAILGQGAARRRRSRFPLRASTPKLPIEKTMPVYITYFTMGRDIDGKLTDLQGYLRPRCAGVGELRRSPAVANRARKTSEKVVEIEAPGA